MSNYYVETEGGEHVSVTEIQRHLLLLLEEMDRVSKLHDIQYALGYGTALGAVRHQGFIPWDDDLDLIMDYANYQKLINVGVASFGPDFYCQSFEIDPHYNVTLPAMKIRLNHTELIEKTSFLPNRCKSGSGIFIDIFIVDSVSSSASVHRRKKLGTVLLMPLLDGLNLLNLKSSGLKSWYLKRAERYARENAASGFVELSITWPYDLLKDRRIARSALYPFSEQMFEGKMYPVPHDIHAYCVASYGEDYMTPPPSSNRVPKHIKSISFEVNGNDAETAG
mgnify:CR=1 FL=1